MADPLPDTKDEPTPRWVKISGIIAVVVVLLVGAMLLTGHGPGRHMAMAGMPMGDTPATSAPNSP
jgi:hypothetical protein